VTSSPAGVSCGSDCSQSYTSGTVVTLTQTPAAGSKFVGWGGACSGAGSCQVTMSAARSVNASFIAVYTLTVAKSGTGSGTVTSSPTGITCGTDCSQPYTYGTVVILTATPASGSKFLGWSGACTGTGTCQVTMNASKSATASFGPS
jgi:Fe-S cluster biogenesis protein NfuA